jgi:hypothetical protein
MAVLIAFPIFAGLVILQGGVISAMPLLRGTADLILLTTVAWALQERVRAIWQWSLIGSLMVSMVSALPFGVLVAAYLLTTFLAVILRRRVWKVPVLAMLATTFIGTLVVQGASWLARWLSGTLIPLVQVFNLITLPSLLLNLLLAVPVYVVVRDLANWLYPEEIEV